MLLRSINNNNLIKHSISEIRKLSKGNQVASSLSEPRSHRIKCNKVIKNKKPTYIRIPKSSFSDVKTTKDYYFKKGQTKDVVIISYGGTARSCLNINISKNIACLLMNKLHPIDKKKILKIVKGYRNILVVEDQMKYNNLYSSICEIFYNEKKQKFKELDYPTT